MSPFESDKAVAPVQQGLSAAANVQLATLKDQVAAWKPNDYDAQMKTRVAYVDGRMKEDLDATLADEFSMSWTDMKNHYTMLELVQHMAAKRAQCFRGPGVRFFLRHREEGHEASPNPEHEHYDEAAEAFEEMVQLAQLPVVLRRIDAYIEETISCAAKSWWDRDHARVSVYTPEKIGVAVNEHRYWDPYTAHGVLFSMPSAQGLRDTDQRYEVWATDGAGNPDDTDESGRPIYYPTKTWITDGNKVWANKDDRNPYLHWQTKKPLMPFVWFTTNTDGVYIRGSHKRIRFNRTINMGLTYLEMNMSWATLGIPVYEHVPGKMEQASQLPASRLLSPKNAVNLPPDVKFSFVRNEIPLERFTNTFEMLIQYQGLMAGLAARSMSRDALPTSGTALRIEYANLANWREEKVEVVRPQVGMLLELMITQRNTHIELAKAGGRNATPLDLSVWEPVYEAGKMDEGPVDYIEMAQRFQPAIEAGVATPDDWAAEMHGIPVDEAGAKVDMNITRNRDLKREGGLYDAGAMGRIFGAGDEEPELDEDGNPIEVDDKDKATPPKGVTPPQLAPTAQAAAAAVAPDAPPKGTPTTPTPPSQPQPADVKPGAEPSKPAPQEPAEPAPAPEDEAMPLGGEMAKLNAYQLRALVDMDVLSRVEVRMRLTGEDEKAARAGVLRARKDNLEGAKAQAKKDEIAEPAPEPSPEG